MRKQYLVILVVLAVVGYASISVTAEGKKSDFTVRTFEDLYRLFMFNSLPPSLDNLYKGSAPETMESPYLMEMIKMVGMFEGIIVNVQNNDMDNATVSFKQFNKQYTNVSKMVPEWENYYNFDQVDKLGKDINNGNISKIFKDIEKIGKSCDRCHSNELAQVWAKYYWRDFNTVNVSTPEGNIPWRMAMQKYLASGFDGISVNAMEGKQKEANDSFVLFREMMLNFKEACSACHNTPRYYFVSDDVMAKVDEIGANISENNLDNAAIIQQQLGENCHRCHVIHQPAQRMKNFMKK